MRAGFSRVELSTPLGTPLMGYGARSGGAESHHDPLFARALYAESSEASSSRVLIVECDLCLMAVSQADTIRDRISRRIGVARECILVGCTHTHSGPDTGLAAVLGVAPAPEWVAALLDAAALAGVQAFESASPARLGVASASVAIGRNRRVANGPVDDSVTVVRIDELDGSPRVLLFLHGCHPTVLGHDNLAVSADWPGVAIARIEATLPGVAAIFALGAHADVDPRTRGLLDLAEPSQSAGAGFAEVEALGNEVADAVLACARNIETRDDAEVAARATTLRIDAMPGIAEPRARQHYLDERRLAALAALDLPLDSNLRTAGFFRLEAERTRAFPTPERRERLATVRGYLRDRTAERFAGSQSPEVEVQVIALGSLRLLALPLEVVVDVGLEWRRRASSEYASIVSIANGWLRYLPHPGNFSEPESHQHYEILQATLVPEAAAQLLDAAERVAAEIDR